jgi:hypothetical protein
MSEKLHVREWVGIGIVLGAILTTIVVSKLSEKRIYKLLETARFEAKSQK